ncbi:hypothetical protein GGR51DRAFT_506716 [Nemania sp. FL0031]|nr:hypothetical protein GGR51DRAFT_506716 [Nemania sp. FL0031]
MDWGSKSGDALVLFTDGEDFICNRDPKDDTQKCRVYRKFEYTRNDEIKVAGNEELDLNRNGWDELADELKGNPKNGYCILTIVPSSLTTFPIRKSDWNKVAKLLYIPKFYARVTERGISSLISVSRVGQVLDKRETLLMSTGTTSRQVFTGKITPRQTIEFAFASTYVESRQFTYAIMVGCTDDQLEKVQGLRLSSREPRLLMLIIFAELQLRRLEEIVINIIVDSKTSKEKLDRERELPLDQITFNWSLIEEVLETIDDLQSAQQDIETVKLQLDKVCAQQAAYLHKEGDRSQGNTPGEEIRNQASQLFLERLDDLHIHLDDLHAQCQLAAKSLPFWSELLLAREQAKLTSKEAIRAARFTKIGTLIALVALFYQPATGVATILSMPIFGWANDWRDLRLQPIATDDQSNANTGSTSRGLPVVSGYIWIYAIASIGLFLITLIPFLFIVKGDELTRSPVASKSAPKPVRTYVKRLVGWFEKLPLRVWNISPGRKRRVGDDASIQLVNYRSAPLTSATQQASSGPDTTSLRDRSSNIPPTLLPA